MNDNGTITVSHAAWLDPATYSLWKSEGLLYRSYIRESAGREDINPSESKDTFLRRQFPEMYEERTNPDTGEPEEHGNPVTVDAYDEQVEASKITDGLVAIYVSEFSGDPANNYRTYWSTHGDPEAILYEDDQMVRYLRYDRISTNEECFLYVYYEAEKAEDGSWSATDASILDMYAYVMDDGTVIESGKKAWSDAGTDDYRTATGE